MAATNDGFGDLGLDIIGVGTQYPPHSLEANSIDYLSEMYYPESPAMKKILSINRFTGIEYRSSIGTPEHPIVNQKNPPSITDLHNVFMSDGVPLAVSASRKAIEEADIDLSEITHIVATTCTDSANPGFDHYVIKGLGMTHQVEKVLLHGVGCSGGLASLRTAANLALGHKFRGKPARILCVALEVSTTLVRSELDSINETQETRIGVALFSDCASAVVLSNGIGQPATPVYSLLGWEHKIIPDTEGDLGFDVDPVGWKVVLSPRVPKLASAAVPTTFSELMSSIPPLGPRYQKADDFDWAMHPGGATILTEAEKAMNISSFHMRASYDTYMKHGNSSSATIFSVMDRLRSKDMDDIAPEGRARDYVVGCAFGPGIAVEMCMLKRNLGARGITGLETPPETESEGSSRSEAGDDGGAQMEGHTSSGRDGGQSFVAEALENLELD
ncbi:Stilbene synthase 3 [Colletotrichum tropicale]|uniref:Stilbene synthase 3 n=1 Tax=Colletotrichum siamense TaxID=690259 RepID=UPI001872298D|nr:Stilbene synthase 3 [Colletotrichum siamense]KAF4826102.1 Stilbene synthase 3 [Colletotrichum tropicale]KAI8180753.1 Stilbene synthase 3 [Colletotrichum sp. SAR 10_65]KAI8180979.1 Stilbene synthase 3 [Colletotrichum sp. SAR 10_75]KAI8214123.1 Stilbene synthase 3 [Colletotrichum sp. SAR 10_76]KAI8221932.1 Stilbene synthase 3 [Colletotrichum sp. SAR 10_96]KAI8236435.1 Stilbene synthase 3 [Colletotrichum sp. SAR 10_77]KAI8249289.1 Stilbene synthase 3 [Colletotrichum sp. SAR 10_98]KAI8280055